MTCLFDTDTLSNPPKKRPSFALLRRLAVTPAEEQFTSSITVGAMVFAAYKSSRTERFFEQLGTKVWPNVRILPFDANASHSYGRLRATEEITNRVA